MQNDANGCDVENGGANSDDANACRGIGCRMKMRR